MDNENAFWHRRFETQLQWTSNTRNFIYRKLHFIDAGSILELGCGTGALLKEIGTRFTRPRKDVGKNAIIAGIEIDPSRADLARASLAAKGIDVDIRTGDARELPFHDESFDIVVCNYFLMWLDVNARMDVVNETRRILKKNGHFIVLAEPDYNSIIDYPDNGMKDALIRSLKKSGATTWSGRLIHGDLHEFEKVHVECCSQPWNLGTLTERFDDEWMFYENVLASAFDEREEFERLKEKERKSIKDGTKFLFIPVFFGLGCKP
nr:methyltransferase domain-containing protein [Candidatus Sigynarchaeota archaeon]